MKQYNRIMLGEHGMYIADCLEHNYIGINVLKGLDLSGTPYNDESLWRQELVAKFLEIQPDKSVGTSRNLIGFLWTVCFGLKTGDIVLASNGEGGYHVGEITGDYYYTAGAELPHRRAVRWLDAVIARRSMSQKLQNSTGSIGTCCNITKYAEEIEQLINGGTVNITPSVTTPTQENYKERSLHRLLSNYLLDQGILSKTIFHETSNRSDQAKKWVHPDMVGVQFNDFQDPATRSFLKAANTKEYIYLYSYELKRTIENDHQLKEYFFQALSNSSWANYGYLVAFEINEEVMEEMERLNRSFGIGVILLSPYTGETKVLFQARKNELDYYTIDKLCRLNDHFKDFITKTTNVLNAQANLVDDVKNGLQRFCDAGFINEDETMTYCRENHIPC
ncbi:hypothetical protein [Prevotella sp. E13-27]|uniref:hypothetical protein n=1 Tax=Prevotella sp. E13-27 TaxID=2938122 RepID=UPI00200AF3D4|nr:hypothetical protein [Prevotella sp. E13-27]MCK8621488.1 hypothetical protein [Prevotella sp. E13-27]